MQPLDVAGLSSAMAGYKAPQTAQASAGSSSPLSGILDTILQLGGMVGGGMLGGPAGAAIGSGLGTGAGELLGGHGLNAGSIGQGALFGLMPGMLGAKGAGAAADLASNVAKDATAGGASALTADTVKAAEGAAPAAIDATATAPVDNLSPTTPATPATPTATTPAVPINPDPANPNSYDVGTHVNLRQYPTGTISTTKVIPPETITPPAEASTTTPTPPVVNPETQPPAGSPAQPTPPAPQTSSTDTFTKATPPVNSQLNPVQKEANSVALNALKQQVQQGGSRLTQAQAGQVAQNLANDGYSNLGKAAQDANFVTGDSGILSNGVNDHINNAEANGASINLGNYNDLAQQHINNALMSGVLTPAQETAAANTLNSVRNIIAGPGAADPTDSSALTHVLPSNNLNAVRALQGQANAQSLIAQGRGVSAEGAKQLSSLYTNMGNDLLDRGFGVANGNAPISDANLENMITQVKGANFNNPNYQQNLVNTLESGKGGNMSLQDLRHLQANHVGYSNAANPNETSNLTNGLMSAGLSKAGMANAVLNSTPGLTLKAKTAQTVSKLFRPGGGGAAPDGTDAGTTNTGGRTMSPIGKASSIAGILGALGLLGNAAATSNQASQANAQLNNPQYQKTQAVLNNSNQLQRYLGQMGDIRSVFAPTFDSNAGQAGTTGQSLLAAANQNQAARTATNNLLTARGSMGQGGILGGILGLIPGTPENTYKTQAANAQAQLNALGIAGSTPSVAQSGGSIPALTSMAGNVGNF
jgi:hypothetical protein